MCTMTRCPIPYKSELDPKHMYHMFFLYLYELPQYDPSERSHSHLVLKMFTFIILANINVWYGIWESICFKEKYFLQKAYLYLFQSCITAFVTFNIRPWLDSLSFKLMFLFDTYTHTCHSSNVVLIPKKGRHDFFFLYLYDMLKIQVLICSYSAIASTYQV